MLVRSVQLKEIGERLPRRNKWRVSSEKRMPDRWPNKRSWSRVVSGAGSRFVCVGIGNMADHETGELSQLLLGLADLLLRFANLILGRIKLFLQVDLVIDKPAHRVRDAVQGLLNLGNPDIVLSGALKHELP